MYIWGNISNIHDIVANIESMHEIQLATYMNARGNISNMHLISIEYMYDIT